MLWDKVIAFINRLFLVKEIYSKEGVCHFRRYRLLNTPWFSIYIHNILASDEDRDPHDHPFGFAALMFWGSYLEEWLGAYDDIFYWGSPKGFGHNLRKDIRSVGSIYWHRAKDFHKITLRTPSVWTLVIAGPRTRPGWGYQTRDRGWVHFQEYRKLKYGVKLTAYRGQAACEWQQMNIWIWVDKGRFETTDLEEALRVAEEYRTRNPCGIYDVKPIEED